ncbi:MAG: hypothetical protein CL779_02760 [Chloroflexi bacterium]|nr:hypothetical protein [Chloroflexota bacterium]|tara:strand:+ start:752 stop:1237 length:486 start_codon:yes stop_codon:yes gene_type:complete
MFTNTNNYNFDYDLQHAGYLYDLLKDTIIFQLSDTESFISDRRTINTKKLMIHRKGINGQPTKVVSKSELFYLLHYTIPDEIECSKKKILDKIKVEYYTKKGDQYKDELNKLNNMYQRYRTIVGSVNKIENILRNMVFYLQREEESNPIQWTISSFSESGK